MTPEISTRARLMPASPIRKLMPLADEAKRRGVHVYHLNIGQPDLETPAPMRERLRRYRGARPAPTRPPAARRSTWARCVEYYRRLGLDPSAWATLLATTGGSEAILFAFLACAGEGDDVLVVEPFYTNYTAFAAMAGVRLVPLTARAEDGFHLPPREAWERALTPAHAHGAAVQPQQPHRHRVHAGGAGDGRGVLPRPRAVPGLGRGVPRVRLRRPRRR